MKLYSSCGSLCLFDPSHYLAHQFFSYNFSYTIYELIYAYSDDHGMIIPFVLTISFYVQVFGQNSESTLLPGVSYNSDDHVDMTAGCED